MLGKIEKEKEKGRKWDKNVKKIFISLSRKKSINVHISKN